MILRHPRLSSDAKTLLNWQLSLPPGERQCLSETARRAGIGKCAFQKAKRQLLAEGYLHEWAVQKEGGRFATVQLVSNVPLSAKEALAVRDGARQVSGGVRLAGGGVGGGRPGARNPAAGEPAGRAAGRLPEKNTGENTTQPTSPAQEPVADAAGPRRSETANPADPTSPAARAVTAAPAVKAAPAAGREEGRGHLAAGEALLLSLGRLDPRFALPVRTARCWAPLAATWLERGLSPLSVRQALTEGLDSARTPLGALRWRLEHALPDAPPGPAAPRAAEPHPEPRLTGTRECEGAHTQPRLFRPRPGTDDTHCPDCRNDRVARKPTPPGSGYATFLAARRTVRPGSGTA